MKTICVDRALVGAHTEGMTPRKAARVEFEDQWTIAASPEQIFPLLCPVREYDWIEDWRCELVHSVSGFAEEDCIFRTDLQNGRSMTWVVTRYEPPRAIEFTCFAPESHVMRLFIQLEAAEGSTRLHWTRRFISLSNDCEVWLHENAKASHAEQMRKLQERLVHYLATGVMLREQA